MAEMFEGRDLSESVFWGVNLAEAKFRDTNFEKARFFHTFWNRAEIDGEIRGLVVNGVDVTDFVNRGDRWYPLRYRLSPSDALGIRTAWVNLCDEWSRLLQRVADSDPHIAVTSVDEEWSLLDTLRHLLFAMDKWFTGPILGDRHFGPWGLPNDESPEGLWTGLDVKADPNFAAVLDARGQQHDRFEAFIETLDVEALPATVTVLENGEVPSLVCFHVVLEEEFEHLRYMTRDLTRLGVSLGE